MPERVWRYVLCDAREECMVANHSLYAPSSESMEVAGQVNLFAAAIADKQRPGIVFTSGKVFFDPLGRSGADENRAVFLTFTPNHKFSSLQVNVVTVES